MNLSRLAGMVLQEISFFWIRNIRDFRSDPNLRFRMENLVSTSIDGDTITASPQPAGLSLSCPGTKLYAPEGNVDQ
jgi:hypothetical protein